MLEEWKRKWNGDPAAQTGGRYGMYVLVVAVCLGLLALLWPSGEKPVLPENSPVAAQAGGVDQARNALAADLERILSQVEGAGAVQVSISLNSDGQKNYARNSKNEHRTTQEADSVGGDREVIEENQSSDIAISGGTALLVEDTAPQVTGVLVVAEGAGNFLVKERLTDATAVLLNVAPHQVRVETRKGTGNDNK